MTVEIEKNGPVWTVINNRPQARNAVDPETADALVAAFEAFEASDAAVAVLWGAGGTFCAGWDLKYAAGLGENAGNAVQRLDFPPDGSPPPRGGMGPSRMALSKPVIAAIEGAAVAGGMELALWCDVRIMAEDAYQGVFCRRWGVTLVDGGTVRMPRLVGFGRAMEITLTGRKVPAEECFRIGLCEQVVPPGDARAAAEEMAHEIARFPQQAVRADRRSMHENWGRPLHEALRREWTNGIDAIVDEGLSGAARFRGGRGRHGDFEEI